MRPIRHMKKVVMVSALLLILTLSLGGGVASKGNDTAATYENLRLFTEVLSIVQSQYVDEVPPKDIIYNAIKGTLRGLDPHSSFLDPDMYREMQVETSGSFGGLDNENTVGDVGMTVGERGGGDTLPPEVAGREEMWVAEDARVGKRQY